MRVSSSCTVSTRDSLPVVACSVSFSLMIPLGVIFVVLFAVSFRGATV